MADKFNSTYEPMANAKVIDVVSAIHKRIREQRISYHKSEVIEDWSNDLGKMHGSYNAAYCSRNIVGTTPQLPSKLLTLLAGWVIGITQRALSWYTAQTRTFNEASVSTLNHLCSLEERNFHAFLALSDRLDGLAREVRLLRAAQTAPATNGDPTAADATPSPIKSAGEEDGPYSRSPIDAQDFFFKLQAQFQDESPAIISQLEMYHSMIGNLNPKIPDGKWLDLGCGRGKWLRVAREGGHQISGVDSSGAAVEQSRESGFHVIEDDALKFLRAADSCSYAVISAFHVLEHCPFDYCLNLVYQIARTLKPGGVLLVETPHAGNLLMATEQFWMDPTHNRPIPISLMQFLFEYCGICVVHRVEVNSRPESEHLPFRELELASRLDSLLYGPQDYAMIGRREPF